MRYWLDLFTPNTWTRFRDHGAIVTGFRPRQRKAAFERVSRGDLMLCYLVKLSRWCGVLEVVGNAYEDDSPVFAQQNDPFVIRFKVSTQIALGFEEAIPISETGLWDQLTFTRGLAAGSVGWAQHAGLRSSLRQIDEPDGQLIVALLKQQAQLHRKYPLDTADLRHISEPTVIRTEKGEVEVEVPDREDSGELTASSEVEIRTSIRFQAKIAQIGATLGFNIWIPNGDRSRVLEALPREYHERVVSSLPLNYDNATLKTIENIDVIWLQRRAIIHAFEIEHTTLIYSGLLRMADLLAMQPRINIGLHVVAPEERREQVRREIVRPVFSVLDGGAMAEKCSFLSYQAVEDLLSKPDLGHMRESILQDYDEFFDT